ncbi:PHP domain-containing protein [Hazenella sp. IB182357]|uniref:PHP domain-containing protein n=1 Tax=Polycladospora coralii TaxID=2771432 RepID=A0A926NCU5_9BACL|nr:PHP domain-containing protein [Polycladospora coralii]MBD1371244.1 PHP domain-containing protein [Polycladospora coralii]
MERRVDLHTHTTASDGILTPEKVVRRAASKGLLAIAITDHDTVSGIEEAQKTGDEVGVEILPGVELSTLWKGTEVHILGYGIDFHNTEFKRLLEKQRNVRKIRNEMMIARLNDLGIPITLAEVNARKRPEMKDLNVGRPHIAEVLMERGVVSSVTEAFERFLGKDGMAYVTPKRISPLDAISLVHQFGGAAVLAHPGLYDQDEIIPILAEQQLDGMEVDYPEHNEKKRTHYRQLAEKYQLLQTAGSDFHGERHGKMYHADIGSDYVTYQVYLQLKKRIQRLNHMHK